MIHTGASTFEDLYDRQLLRARDVLLEERAPRAGLRSGGDQQVIELRPCDKSTADFNSPVIAARQ